MSRFLRAFAALAIALPACSSSSSAGGQTADAGGDAAGGSYKTACDALAKATCARELACSPFFVEFAFGDQATCEASVRYRCGGFGVLAGVSWTPQQISTCSETLASATCGVLFGGVNPCAPPAGTLPAGGPCYYDEQCASRFCKVSSSQPCGSCANLPAPGDLCEKTCGPELVCARGACVVAAAADGPCSGAGECPPTQTCFQGKCVAPAKEGEACDPTGKVARDCDFVAGLACSPNKCTKILLAKAGGACGYAPGAIALCEAGGACGPDPTNGTCGATVPLGQPCSTSMGPACAPGALCVNGVCRVPDATACR